MASFRDSFKVPVLIPSRDPETGHQKYDAAGNAVLEPKLDAEGNPELKPEPRLWVVTITYGVALELKRRHQLDLLSDDHDLAKVLNDPIAVLQILDVALEKQLAERGMRIEDLPHVIGDMELAQRMDDAVMEAVIDFFPSRHRDPLLASRRKLREAVAKRDKVLTDRLKQTLEDPRLMKHLESELDRTVATTQARIDRVLQEQLASGTPGTSPSNSEEPSES